MAAFEVRSRPRGRRRALPAGGAGPIWLAGAALVAAATLLLPSAPTNDPWAWLVWGREVAHLSLDTTAGASWKPGPVLITTPLSLLGDAAPEAWLLIARMGAILALLAAYRLASRFAGPVAGVLAAGALVLTPGPDSRSVYYAAHGLTEPLLATLVLFAVERHLDGRRGQALVLGVLAALLRPEAWPFLTAYAIVLGLREPRLRAPVLSLLPLVALAWFGGDWWGSGDPFTGGDRARGGGGLSPTLPDLLRAVRRGAELVAAPVWLAAAAAVVLAVRRGEHTVVALGAGALGWVALVVGMAALDFPAAPRFMLPAGAVVSVLAGIAAVRIVALAGRGGGWGCLAAAAVMIAASAPFLVPRALAVPEQVEDAATRARVQSQLRAAVARVRYPDRLFQCGDLTVEQVSGEATALAWTLEVPMNWIDRLEPGPWPRGVVMLHSLRRRRALHPLPAEVGHRRREQLARAGSWHVFAAECSPGDRGPTARVSRADVQRTRRRGSKRSTAGASANSSARPSPRAWASRSQSSQGSSTASRSSR